MKVICEREKLLSAFQMVTPVVPARSPKPILQNIDVGSDTVTLMGTDLEIGIRAAVSGVEIKQPGLAILPTGKMSAILRECSDEFLTLESDDSGLSVRGDRNHFNLPSQDPHEFPSIADFDAKHYHKLSGRQLREVIRRTVFATDNESSRYALGGVYFELQGGKLTAVGTDGRRMAVCETTAEESGEAGPQTPTIIPAKALSIIERSIGDSDEMCLVAPRANDVLVKSDRAVVYSRLVEGRFPRWRDVLPDTAGGHKIDCVAGPFLSAVRQAAIVTDQDSRGVNFTFADGQLSLAARVANAGQAEVQMPIAYDAEPITITLDPRYLIDFLRVLEAEQHLTFEIQNGESAILCSTDDGYRYVVMPLSRD